MSIPNCCTHYTFLINSLRNGGAERVVLTLAEAFIKQGNRVTVISLTQTNAYPIPKGVKMVYLTEADDGNSGLKRMLLIPYYAWKLRNYSKKEAPKVIQSHIFRSNFVNVLSVMMGAKHQTQLVNHSVASRYLSQGRLGRLNLTLIRFFYPKANMVIALSQKMLHDLESLVKLPKERNVIPNPYDTYQIAALAEEPVDEFLFESHTRYLITVGRLITLKRYGDVISVLAKLPQNVELILLGADGGEKAKLQALALELKVAHRTHFLGQVSNPFKFIKRSDLLILSSQTEGFPNVLIEAMVCRTAIVSSDCLSGPREILAPDTPVDYQLKTHIEAAAYGILYPVGSLSHLEEAIGILLANHQLKTRYEQAGRERAKAFSVEKVIRQYEKALAMK